MSTPGNITEINITSTQGKTGNFSVYCPYSSGTSQRRAWFQHLAAALARPAGAETFRLYCSDGTYYLDRSLVSSVTITYS
ncbi:hypothetical protein LCGC14_1255280 [marine sediment metagenome]|uniref:Uncharacterized protein n=1 Tax=marine sediment metagenome TaxID=412755 RepID=A0A0F9LNL0_9ZZZZ